MRFFSALFFVLLFLFALSAALPAEGAGEALLEGLVRTTDGRLASGAEITVWDGRTRRSAVTDAEGKFSVSGIPPGFVFAVRISPRGHRSVRMDGFRFPEQDNLYLSMEYGTVRRGTTHTSRIPSNPTTGYQWGLLEPGNQSAVVLRDNVMEPPQETPGREVAGRGGHELWTFEAVGRGSSTVILGYRRPWETRISPVRYHVLELTVR